MTEHLKGPSVWCAVVLLSACSVFDESLVDSPSAGVPPRPPESTSSPNDSEERVFVLRNFYLNQSAEIATQLGIDVDGLDTTDLSNSGCQPRLPDDDTLDRVRDGINGSDNSLGTNLTELLNLGIPCMEDDVARLSTLGVGTVVYTLRGWNGQRDDARVEVALTSTVAGTSAAPGDVEFENDTLVLASDGTPAPTPVWDGADNFYVDPADFFNADFAQPRRVTTTAYVAGGRIVTPLRPNDGLQLFTGDGNVEDGLVDGSVNISPLDGFNIAELNDDGTEIVFGVFGGKTSLTDLRVTAERLGACGGLTPIVNDGLDRVADVLQTSGGSADESCDAVSFAVPFQGLQANVVGLGPTALDREVSACVNDTARLQFCCPTTVAAGTAPADCDVAPYMNLPNPIPVQAPARFANDTSNE